ncbi:MAG: hypothetical protein PWQ59_2390 [Thermoanaerobacterium sp.]|nr:hypothetical protein [Thermoanaerobacterium sp.]
MKIPWSDMNIPKRVIFVDANVIDRFPVFWKLVKDKLKKEKVRGTMEKILLQNIASIGLFEKEKLLFKFQDDGYYERIKNYHLNYRYTINIPNFMNKEDADDINYKTLNDKYYKLKVGSIYRVLQGKTAEQLLSFFMRLNKKTENLYTLLNMGIADKIMNSEFNKYLDENDLKKYLEFSDFTAYFPTIDFIDYNDFDENGKIIYYPYEEFYNLMVELENKSYSANEDFKDRVKRYRYMEELILDLEKQIKVILENVPEKYIIDLSKI